MRETALQATERRFSEQQSIREITAMEAQRMPVFRWLTCALSLAVKVRTGNHAKTNESRFEYLCDSMQHV